MNAGDWFGIAFGVVVLVCMIWMTVDLVMWGRKSRAASSISRDVYEIMRLSDSDEASLVYKNGEWKLMIHWHGQSWCVGSGTHLDYTLNVAIDELLRMETAAKLEIAKRMEIKV